jgi:hypothetical protein
MEGTPLDPLANVAHADTIVATGSAARSMRTYIIISNGKRGLIMNAIDSLGMPVADVSE